MQLPLQPRQLLPPRLPRPRHAPTGNGAISSSTSVDTKNRPARSRDTDRRTGTTPAGNSLDHRTSNGPDCFASVIDPVPGRSGSSTQRNPVRTYVAVSRDRPFFFRLGYLASLLKNRVYA
ncbi:hypothetical protein QFZ66_004818 [Streptomyces sp. B4I13]|uniref:hypothetical protein n=1 Tax=Streptomyces sp. B4I13 TaxID=3042271 RepID=UPI002787F2B9|nr:hypothetical protein [Streptomyces sp. B4I13]MDQ0960940.1 hypothetical protein [Streptomyces sp. B4I13]